GDAMPGKERTQALVELARDSVDVPVEAGGAVGRHGGEAGGDGDRVAVVGAAVLTVARRHQSFHDLAAAAKNAQRKATADRLPQRTKVRRHPEVLLRPTR